MPTQRFWEVNFTSLFVSILGSCSLFVVSSSAEAARYRSNFDAAWSFQLGDPQGAEQADFDSSEWRKLDVPHDWSVEGRFEADHPVGAPGGYLPAGIGWYRKTFELPAELADRHVFIEFDGVYMNSEVWINGQYLGKRPYGYLGFEYELTPHLKFGGENVIAVRVDDSRQPSGRWYTGTGIYRHVWLKHTAPVHVSHWGTYVTTPEVAPGSAKVAIETTIQNHLDAAKSVTVKQTILDKEMQSAATTQSVHQIPAAGELTVDQSLDLRNPKLWSPDEPNLYSVRTELVINGAVVDSYHTPLGVRTLRFDRDEGLFVNDKPVIMKGMCNHQDLGPLGTALWDEALRRRMVMLKEMGCNALRTAHYPHSPEFMRMADEMGFLVVNETFDEWRQGWAFEDGVLVSSGTPRGKARHGYNRYFDEWHERDLTDHLKRDRNHPSVMMWSIGNEVAEAQKNGEVETVRILRDIVRKVDPTRPVTAGINHIRTANETGFLDVLDIVGYNGGGGSCFLYEEDHKRFPNRIIYASEVPHSLQTRGEYRTHTNYRETERQTPNLTEIEVFPETDAWYESSYDNAAVRINARDSWHLTKTLPFVLGEFRWTGFDYIGESGGWPRVLGNFGVIDLVNLPKDTYYFYQSQWSDKPMIHLLPHWNWPGKEGTVIPVHAYTTGDEAELFLNGTSVGIRKITEQNPYHLEWMVPYTPGELRAVARKNGEEISSSVIRTAGPPARFVIEADQTALDPDRRDLSYITIRIEDADGNFDPKAARWVTLNVSGPGRIVGIHNGDPMSHNPLQSDTVRTFNGLAVAIIASTSGPDAPRANEKREPGEIVVRAQVRGWESREIRLIRTSEGIPEATLAPDKGGPRATDVYDDDVPPVD
ncbi:MAG: glycoside hydrolase family 2 TIM barrel-domain containing protein [Luteolibacter sp.]